VGAGRTRRFERCAEGDSLPTGGLTFKLVNMILPAKKTRKERY
jgi:hypothetical protein